MTVRQLVVEARVRGTVNRQAAGWVDQLVSHLARREMSTPPRKESWEAPAQAAADPAPILPPAPQTLALGPVLLSCPGGCSSHGSSCLGFPDLYPGVKDKSHVCLRVSVAPSIWNTPPPDAHRLLPLIYSGLSSEALPQRGLLCPPYRTRPRCPSCYLLLVLS